jgi:inorganic pyrophosphatase
VESRVWTGLFAVATHAHLHGKVESIKDMDSKIVEEVEAFFHHYNRLTDSEFKVLDLVGPKRAMKLIKAPY